jgi:predicted RNase H-like HicB family nuclease
MRYPVVIHKDRRSNYGVTVPDLAGCFSAGKTIDQALAMAAEAIELHIEGLIDEGYGVPVPGRIEDHKGNADYAGGMWALVEVDESNLRVKAQRVSITMPERTLDAVDRYAAEHRTNRSALLTRAALAYIGRAGDRGVPAAKRGRPRTGNRAKQENGPGTFDLSADVLCDYFSRRCSSVVYRSYLRNALTSFSGGAALNLRFHQLESRFGHRRRCRWASAGAPDG